MMDEWAHRAANAAKLREHYARWRNEVEHDYDIRRRVLNVVARRNIRGTRAVAIAVLECSLAQVEDAGGKDEATALVAPDLIDLLNVHHARFDRAARYTRTGKARSTCDR